ncbi:MAG: mannan-binding lectin [Nostoc sp.]|uniref:mannan-binding lectin n=1 Tax=Nostoc sp. TaxID=1180 RepID=UPI002FF45C84
MLNFLKVLKGVVSYFSSKVQTSKKFRKRLLLPFCSLIVCYFVLVGVSGKTFAIDFPAGRILNNNDARHTCPAVCRNHNYHWHGQWKTRPNDQSVCGCGWDLDKKGAVFNHLNDAEQRKFDTFQNAINNRGLSAKDAAHEIGDSDYKKLQGNQYQIRLSRNNRVTFLVEDDTHIVKILIVGGHT